MTLSDLASIGSLISGIAVLISLIYLALQVRQAEKNQRALINQGVTNRATDAVKWLAQPPIVDLLIRVFAGETEFTALELVQLAFAFHFILLDLQDGHLQRRAGLIDEIAFDNMVRVDKRYLIQPVMRALWRRSRANYAPEFAQLVDGLIAELPLAGPADIVASFKADLAEIAN